MLKIKKIKFPSVKDIENGIKKSILKPINKSFDMIMKPIMLIVNYFKCGIKKIKTLGDCILFYIIDMLVGIYFLLWNMFATAFGFKKPGQDLWKFINKYQKVQYSRDIIKKCYLC